MTPAETSDLVTVKIFSASDICNRTADNVQSMIHFGTMCAIEGRGGGGRTPHFVINCNFFNTWSWKLRFYRILGDMKCKRLSTTFDE